MQRLPSGHLIVFNQYEHGFRQLRESEFAVSDLISYVVAAWTLLEHIYFDWLPITFKLFRLEQRNKSATKIFLPQFRHLEWIIVLDRLGWVRSYYISALQIICVATHVQTVRDILLLSSTVRSFFVFIYLFFSTVWNRLLIREKNHLFQISFCRWTRRVVFYLMVSKRICFSPLSCVLLISTKFERI